MRCLKLSVMISDRGTSATPRDGVELVILNQYYLPDVASSGQLLAELALEAARMGRRVSVITSIPSYGPPESWVPCPAKEVSGGVAVRRLRTTRFRKDSMLGRISNSLTFLVPLAIRMLLAPSRGRIYMYTSNPPFLGIIGAVVSMIRRHPYVVLLHDSYPHVTCVIGRVRKGSLLERAWHAANALIYRRARRTIVLCNRAKDLVTGEYGIAPDTVQVIHNWADPRAIFPLPKQDSSFARTHGYDRVFTVLYSGNIGLYYDFDTLLEAARLLSGEPDFRLVFVGAGGRRNYVERRIAELGLRNVDLHQYQPFETLNDSLNACDVSLVTIARGIEGISFPSKLYSSLAAGKPVLALSESNSELREIVEGSGSGLWSEVGDAEALARNILALRDRPDAARAMGERARALMERDFTVTSATKDYLSVIDAAAAQ